MPPIANTRYGQLQGMEEDGLSVFRGVPFAAPPVVEGGFLETLPIDAVRNGRSKDVDLLCGTIEDEWTLLAALGGVNELDEAGARGALAVTAGRARAASGGSQGGVTHGPLRHTRSRARP